jgi:hypothetical protein
MHIRKPYCNGYPKLSDAKPYFELIYVSILVFIERYHTVYRIFKNKCSLNIR